MIKIEGIKLSCISCCVPNRYEFNKDLPEFAEERKQKIIESTGVVSRPVVDKTQCTSDLVYQAAVNLIQRMGIEPAQIGVMILVTQTPDYILPATSCIIHNRLKLCEDTIVFDINLGCSGYIYGLYVASTLLKTSDKPYALLLAGDTISKYAGMKMPPQNLYLEMQVPLLYSKKMIALIRCFFYWELMVRDGKI